MWLYRTLGMEIDYRKGSLNDSGEGEILDPKIKDELENLNQTSAEVNRLENELDEARANYKMTFTEASNKMTELAKDHKRSIQKAREYYELKEEVKRVQSEAMKAARQYQSAIGVYRAAKETVALAEERLLQGGEVQLTTAWQEMLNHATIRVMEAEKEKRRSEEQHQKTTSQWQQLEGRIHVLEKTYKRSIANARSYFEMKQQLDIKLQQQKQNVIDLQQAIKGLKSNYAGSLKELEHISEAIHETRRQKLLLMYPRQPGVGAESDCSLASSTSELTIDPCDKEITPADRDCDSSDNDEYAENDNVLHNQTYKKIESECTDDSSSDTNIPKDLKQKHDLSTQKYDVTHNAGSVESYGS